MTAPCAAHAQALRCLETLWPQLNTLHRQAQESLSSASTTPEAGTCAAGQECRMYGRNPHDGTISFDNIVFAWITIFQCITLEGWFEVTIMVVILLNMLQARPSASQSAVQLQRRSYMLGWYGERFDASRSRHAMYALVEGGTPLHL